MMMKLYYSPGACSLSPHIVLHEAGLEHGLVKVDLKSHTTETGQDYYEINPKGSVPALELDNGEILTEGPAIIQYIADQVPAKELAAPNGTMNRYRLQEALNYITSEIHKSYGPLWSPSTSEEAKAAARENLTKKFAFMDNQLAQNGPYLFGSQFSVADAYLYVMTTWAEGRGVNLNRLAALATFIGAMEERDSVKDALNMEKQHQKAA